LSRARFLIVAVIATIGAGCAGAVEDRLAVTRRTILLARERGAYRCAPEALARAEARVEFTRLELRAGELVRAESELDRAEAAAAIALASAQSCRPIVARSATPPPPPEIKEVDSDGDGILDPDDRCPKEPEDLDGWKDEDGCPDPDDDEDGVLDADDRCPRVPGSAKAKGCPDRDGDAIADGDDRCPDEPGVPEQEGCPAPKLIVVQKDRIELKQKIHFATGKATILSDSTPLLTEIASALKKLAKVRVRIEGHTDSRGSAQLNTRLSRARAESVRAWLVQAGIDAARMTAVGYGPSQPIADNRTAAGREENRRVEFFLLEEQP